MATQEEREKPKQVKEKGDHRAGIVFGSKPRDQLLAGSAGFGEGQRAGRAEQSPRRSVMLTAKRP
jgi:hypothetical protein